MRRASRKPVGANRHLQVNTVEGVRKHAPYQLVEGIKVTEVLVMSNPYLVTFRNSEVHQDTLCLDVVSTDGEFRYILLDEFGIPGKVNDNNRRFYLAESERRVVYDDIRRALDIYEFHTSDYKMEAAANLAKFFLSIPDVKRVALYGSLARHGDGHDIDMVLYTQSGLAYANLERVENENLPPVLITRERKALNHRLIDLLDLSPVQQEELERLIYGGHTRAELVEASDKQLWTRCLELDIQVLPNDEDDLVFRDRYLARSHSGGRGYENDFLTQISQDLKYFNLETETFI